MITFRLSLDRSIFLCIASSVLRFLAKSIYRSRVGHTYVVGLFASMVSVFAFPANAQHMATGGTTSVANNGAASYSIGIQVPPGIGGVAPKLSLEYNSQGGNGLLGVGWNLAGLSVITRCGARIATDGMRGGVNYTSADRFCMDGQRLLSSSGTYGAAGSVYRTELDSFSQVTANGTQGVGPASFTVKTKSGLTLQYGGTIDSAISVVGSSTIRLWALNKVSDSVGNFMTVSYTTDAVNGSYYPASINYTGNGAQSPSNSVAFGYVARSDQIPLYTGGAMVKNTQLLSSIKSYANGQLVKTYLLSYKSQTFGSQLSALTGVQEIFADGSTLPATQFNWPGYLDFSSACTSNCGQIFATTPISSIADTTVVAPAASTTQWQMVAGDLTGDGRNDLVGYLVSGATMQVQAWLSNGLGSFTKAATMTPVNLGASSMGANLLIGDINGDGIPDLVVPTCNSSNGNLSVSILKGNGDGTFGTPVTTTYAGNVCTGIGNFRLTDQNGTGQSDLMWVTAAGTTVNIHALLNNGSGGFAAPKLLNGMGANTTPAGFTAANIQPNIYWIDINNDGIPDMVLLYMNGNSIAVQAWPGQSNGYLGSSVTLLNYTGTPGNATYTYATNYNLQLVDVNGDGAPDLMAMGAGPSGASADIWMNTGAGTFASVPKQNVVSFSGADLTKWTPNFADVNGDGIVDIVYASANAAAGTPAAYTFFGNGDGTFTQAFGVTAQTGTSAAGASGWNILMSDTSGSGRTDLLAWNPNASGMYVQTWTNAVGAAPTLVSGISNGAGVSANFTYSTLSNTAVYTKGGATNYPQINLNIPLNVVSSVASPDGVGGTLTTSYHYSGLRTEEYTGRGMLGFASMSTTQQQGANTVSTTSVFSQNWPFTGLPLTITKTNSAAAEQSYRISLITNTYDCLNTAASGSTGSSCVVAAGNTYFPYAKQTVEQSWDLDGTVLPTITSTNSFDGFGNALTTTSGTGDGYSKTTANTYINDTTNWFLGRLTQSALTSVSPAGAITRTSAFTYNPSNGLLASETIEPNLSQFCQLTSYTYDTYGNKSGATTANCAGASGTAMFASRSSASSTAATTANPIAGQFVTSTSNALGQSESHQYDARFGLLTSLTGPNGLTTTWSLDALGRQTLETRADGNKTQTQYLYCAGVNGGTASCPSINGATGAFVVVNTPLASDGVTPNGATSKAYLDALGRKIRTETQGFDGSGSTAAIYQDIEYNNLGQVAATSRPYYAGQTVYWNTTTYDALGRAVLSTLADNSTSTVSYSGLVTSSTNAKNQTSTTTKNSQAQVVSVKDANGQVTSFTYDPVGNLTSTIDVANNTTTLTYDIKGRKTQMVDPDMGTWTYTYDALGQLIGQLDAKLNSSAMTYDLLGRMTQRSESDLISNWYFDRDSSNTACAFGVGKLCQSTTSIGYSRKASFDNLGRVVSNATTLDTSYTDSATYDANGRIATRTYPGGMVLKYNYTPLGYLQSITRVSSGVVLWMANALDAEGHLLQQTLGNGLSTTQAYNPANGRITSITTGAGNAVQNSTYQYDALGNVSNRNDNTQSLVETFGYDNLNRMQTSTVNASAAIYTDTFAYANSGNINSRSDLGTYSYQTIAIPATSSTSCPANSTYQGGFCVFNQTTPATPNYTCAAGTTPNGANCQGTTTVPATIDHYVCPNGSTQPTSTCSVTTTTPATVKYDCPIPTGTSNYQTCSFSRQTTTCTPLQSYAQITEHANLTGSNSCDYLVLGNINTNGYLSALTTQFGITAGSWNQDYGQVEMGTTARVNYSCTTGTQNGASCIVSTSVLGTPAYVCTSGTPTASGTSCSVPTSVPATIANYSCSAPNQYPVGNQCVTTSNATTTYTCPTSGQIPIGSQCVSNALVNSGPHALSLVAASDLSSSRFFTYDANGNRTSELWQQGSAVSSTRAYSYTSFNMATTFAATANGSTVSETYSYGPEHQRVKQVSSTLGTVYYLNPGNSGDLFFEKEIKPDNSVELRSYVSAGGSVIAEIKQLTSNANVTSEQTRYFQRDSLGSTSVITDESGNVLARLAYEPFGKRRQATGPQDSGNAITDPLGQRGFTNHEHMDELGLINMNGRVYDPMTARFISADPMIQAPMNSQSYNRYSYIANSPLNATDPSGFCFICDVGNAVGSVINGAANSIGSEVNHWGDVIRTDPAANMVATAVVAYFTGEYVGTTLGAESAVGAAAGGFAGGMVSSGGNINSGFQGAASAWMFYEVGSTWDAKGNPTGNVAGHAAVGCISATMGGGNCGSGALSAGIADYATLNMPDVLKGNDKIALQTAYVAVVGGTTSVMSGGKFENGAETAAFGYLFNELLHQGDSKTAMRQSGYGDSSSTPVNVTFGPVEGGGIYDRLVMVTDADGLLIGQYLGSIDPDTRQLNCANGCPTIAGGSYDISAAYRSKYNGTVLVVGNNGIVPTDGPNPNQGYQSFATGVYVHTGYLSGTFAEGCLTISPGSFNQFISQFPRGWSGTLQVVK